MASSGAMLASRLSRAWQERSLSALTVCTAWFVATAGASAARHDHGQQQSSAVWLTATCLAVRRPNTGGMVSCSASHQSRRTARTGLRHSPNDASRTPAPGSAILGAPPGVFQRRCRRLLLPPDLNRLSSTGYMSTTVCYALFE